MATLKFLNVQITEDTFEQALHLFREAQEIDLHDVTFIDPYGMVGILEIGEILKSKGIQKTIYLPKSDEVLKYLERMDFFRLAGGYFKLEPPVTSIIRKIPEKFLFRRSCLRSHP